ncbi:1-acyl-sn-glycerol-3-phosphate acyltransferase [bacterium]|nr:1-acyl-sn-glycerol-3-phosphate acyltransferase [bacterium]
MLKISAQAVVDKVLALLNTMDVKQIYYFLKSLYLFAITLKYLVKSYLYPRQITELKKQWGLRLLNYLGYHVTSYGIPPTQNKSYICVGNHISFLDIVLLMAVHPEIIFLSKSEVKHWPIIGPAARRVGTLFVNRDDKSDRSALRKQIGRVLQKSNRHLAIFPSGTTSLDENILWKKGAFEIAQEYSIPVYAFKINYTPLRESAYINEDTLLSSMCGMFAIKNKKAEVRWLSPHSINQPELDAEKIKELILL